MAKTKTEAMFEEIKPVEETLLVKSDPVARPSPRDEKWSDYVLAQLSPDEKDEKNQYPKTAGLKRMVTLLIGTIVDSRSTVVEVPSLDNNFTAIVKHSLRVKGYDEEERNVQAIGESNENNSDSPFSKYPCAVASSRAQGRAYRDLLSLNCVVAEEVSIVADGFRDDDPITSTQKVGIELCCKRLNVDVNKFINIGATKYNSINDVTTGTAVKMMSQLNQYQQNKKAIPDNIRGSEK